MVLNAFHVAGIIISKVIQFYKMAIQLPKSILVDYFNDKWYINIYHYNINQQSLLVDYIHYIVIKKETQYYWYNSFIK